MPIDGLQQFIETLEAGEGRLLAAALAAAVLISVYVAHRLLFRFLQRPRNARWMGSTPFLIVLRLRRASLALILLAIAGAVVPAVTPAEWLPLVTRTIAVLATGAAGWVIIGIINGAADAAVRRHRIDVEDNLLARKYQTQIRVLRRTGTVFAIIITFAAMLATIPQVREYGISLLASAGAAGIVLGFAARPVLSNLIAGIQIALTQPIRIEDVVIVDGEWGWVEEITATYVVVRIWDWRRMVVPLTYFIETPFQNWTRETASIIGSVFWHVDYTVPVERVREKLNELLDASPLWDRDVANLQVTDSGRDTVQLRALMSAKNSPTAWDLRCEIREQMIAWLQAEYPGALPRMRAELAGGDTDDVQQPRNRQQPV